MYDWVTSCIEVISSLGFGGVFALIVVLFFACFFFGLITFIKSDRFVVFCEEIHNKIFKKQEEQAHLKAQEATKKRMDAIYNINIILNKMLLNLGCDRAAVFEMHNGKDNPSGLPFLYIDMTHEEVRDGVKELDDECANLNIARYRIMSYLWENRIFAGTIDELKSIDNKFVLKACDNDTKKVVLVMLKTTEDMGVMELAFNNEELDMGKAEVLGKLLDYVQPISQWLDIKNQSINKCSHGKVSESSEYVEG